MKTRIWIAAISVLLSAAILLLLPSAQPPTSQQPTASTTVPTATPGTKPTMDPPEPGVVRLYSCNLEKLPLLNQLAADYTAQTGTEVVVLTAGESGCMPMLEMLMTGENPPTILCMHSQKELLQWQDSLLDLNGTALEEALCAEAFGWRVNSRLLALPMELEGMGLLFNARLLSVVMTRNDIMDHASLVTAVQVLESNGLTAFANVPHWMPVWLRLLNSSDRDTMRAFIDLYMANQIGSGDAMDQFMSGKTVFFLGTTADFGPLSQQPNQVLELRDLDILPACTAEGLHYICKTAWGVNGKASPADMEASLAFLTWLVTATEEAPAPVDQLQTLAPFRDAAWYGNQLEKKLRSYMQTEAAVLVWDARIVDDRNLLLALSNYANDPSDANWAVLVSLLPQAQENQLVGLE